MYIESLNKTKTRILNYMCKTVHVNTLMVMRVFSVCLTDSIELNELNVMPVWTQFKKKQKTSIFSFL